MNKNLFPPMTTRNFQAGAINRLTADWNPNSLTSFDYELWRTLRTMRRRSRDLCKNNDYARKFLQMCVSNILGPQGIRLQVRATDSKDRPNRQLSTRVEKAWTEWGKKKTASVSQRQSWFDLQRLFVVMLARDGEVLVHKRVMPNKFGFSLKLLNVDMLDENYNRRLANGNRIIMGVELDPDDRRVAYWLRENYAGLLLPTPTTWTYKRVPAEEILHCFVQEDTEQTRGVPWLFTAIFRLRQLGAYEEAEVIGARIGASRMGFYKKPVGTEVEMVNRDAPPPVDEIEPGQFVELPDGWEVESFHSEHPHTNYSDFVKSVLRGVASGLGVSYNGLAEDLEGVNFSSLRAGLLGEQSNWRVLQKWVSENFHEDIYPVWLESALLTGAVTVRPRELPQIQDPQWQPRGWPAVDPVKEAQAQQMRLAMGIEALSDLAAEAGDDFEEKLQRRRQDRELMEQYGEKPPSFGAASGMSNPQKGGTDGQTDSDSADSQSGESESESENENIAE